MEVTGAWRAAILMMAMNRRIRPGSAGVSLTQFLGQSPRKDAKRHKREARKWSSIIGRSQGRFVDCGLRVAGLGSSNPRRAAVAVMRAESRLLATMSRKKPLSGGVATEYYVGSTAKARRAQSKSRRVETKLLPLQHFYGFHSVELPISPVVRLPSLEGVVLSISKCLAVDDVFCT